eukprot:CAMPEP_0174250936 /NCGR_PEP_ID=MMETSP0439-20130205/935_1 /TAXON_ID=0 /ORGANISM="Stereomyxa ramosa, Strain Chinc5" /LENGTH=332 /DNA_ID=CAMNT_0015331121 /DNA_START=12 /DNA_END=1007 /DNA_ORIENTATION=-
MQEGEKEDSSKTFDKDGLLWITIVKNSTRKGKGRLKEGEVPKQKYTKWNKVYVTLIGGSLHCYKSDSDPKLKLTIELGESEFLSGQQCSGKSGCLLFKEEKREIYFHSQEQHVANAWATLVEENKDREKCAPLARQKRMSRVHSFTDGAKKKAAGSLVTSSLGKKAIEMNLPEEVYNFLAAVKVVVAKDTGDKEFAKKMEDNVLRIGLKLVFIVRSKKLSVKELVCQVDEPFRACLDLFSKCYSAACKANTLRGRRVTISRKNELPTSEGLREDLENVSRNATQTASTLKNLLTPFVREKNINRIDFLTNYWADPDILHRILTNAELEDELW